MMKKIILSALMWSLVSLFCTVSSFAQSSKSAVASQDLDSGSLSFTTSFLETDAGFLSYVGLSFAGGTNAPESVETIVVYAASRAGGSFDVELARITTIAATTRTVTFLFNGAIPVSSFDQIRVTCTNASQSAGEVNDDPTISATVVIDNTQRSSGTVNIFRDGALVVSSLIHDHRMHTGDIIPAANQEFGAFYADWANLAAPANPGAGVRRLYVDSGTGKLSVRTNAGSTVSLEEVDTNTGHVIEEDGTPLTQRTNLNFTSGGVTCSDSGGKTVCDIPANPTAGHTIQEDGSSLTQRANLNFVGSTITCTDDAGNNQTDCTVAGGSGHTIEDEGTPLAAQPDLNFTGGGITCTDDGPNTATVCNVPAGGGSGDITTVGSCTNGDCAIEGGNDIFPFLYEGTANTEETTFSTTNPTADRTITFPDLGGTIALQSGAGFTNGSIPFYAGSQLIQDNAEFFWDDTDNELGISTTSPGYDIDVRVSSAASQLHFTGNNADDGGYVTSTGTDNFFTSGGAAYDATNWIAKDTEASIIGSSSGNLRFYTDDTLTVGNSFTPSQRMHIDSNGLVGVGTTTPDGLFDVEGEFYISEVAAPGTPASGKAVIYATSANNAFFKNDAGVAYSLRAADVMAGGHSTTITATAANYFPMNGLVAAVTTTDTIASTVSLIVPVAGTFRNLYCRASAGPGGVVVRSYFLRNTAAADTAITCTMTGAATTCSDTTNSHTAVAGAIYNMKTTASAVSAAMATKCSLEFYAT